MRERTGATPERLALAVRAKVLRERGLLVREIAGELGCSLSHASALLNDPDGAKQRALKDTYRGVCGDCGNSTDGSNGRGGAPDVCVRCYDQRRAAQHGTSSKYRRGCRCVPCCRAHTSAHREWRRRTALA